MPESSYYDVVILGGGIHGVGVAQAAAAAGHSVLMLEKNRPAAGTSSRSSKLIHGGLRYLESAQISLVRESLRERELLLSNAPDLVRLVPFCIPVYQHTRRRPWQIRADGTPRWDGKHNFTLSSSESGSTYQCKIDNGAYATVTSPYTTAVLSNGSHTFTCIGKDTAGNTTSPVVKPFGVFKDPAVVSKSGSFQWGLACTGNSTLNSLLGCPDSALSLAIPANPNGITGNYIVDLRGQINGLASTIGFGSTYTMYIIVDGNNVASDHATVWFDIFGAFHADLDAVKNGLTLSSGSPHSIQLSLKSSSFLSVLPSVSSSSLRASIHH